MSKGTVKWFSEEKGYGFIDDGSDDGDVFLHYSEIQADGFKTLKPGDKVEFDITEDHKGRKARNIVKQ